MFLCHLRVVHGNPIYLEILSCNLIQRLTFLSFTWSKIAQHASMSSMAGRRKGGRNGMHTPFKGDIAEVVHITFKNISLARILLHGHYLGSKGNWKMQSWFWKIIYTDKFRSSMYMGKWAMEDKQESLLCSSREKNTKGKKQVVIGYCIVR